MADAQNYEAAAILAPLYFNFWYMVRDFGKIYKFY